MDIVYLMKQCQSCEELNYSLRSLANIPHDKVFMVGGCPSNLKNVTHIPSPQNLSSKFKNTTIALHTAASSPLVSDDFILMNDDFFVVSKIKDPAKELRLCAGTMNEVLERMLKRHGKYSDYMKGMRDTQAFLRNLGCANPISFELHVPIVMNKKNVLAMFDLPGFMDIPIVHKRSVYGNLFINSSCEQIQDVKMYVDRPFKWYEKRFLSCSDKAWRNAKPILLRMFPNKSEYEK